MKKRRNRIIIALILFGIATIIRFPEGRINNVIYIVSYLIEETEQVVKNRNQKILLQNLQNTTHR